MTSPLVPVSWLIDNLTHPDLVILDARMAQPASGAESPFTSLQIPGARQMQLKTAFSEPGSELPNTIPSPEHFQQEAQKLGINQNSVVVVYDDLGVYSSPRAWWLFHVMGHRQVYVLNGGLPAWVEAGQATESLAEGSPLKGDFIASFDADRVWSTEQVSENLTTRKATVIDARSSARFRGEAPEPRAGLLSGHIPESLNLPFGEVVKDGNMLPKEELQKVIADLDPGAGPVVFSCGSGITACIILLAYFIATDTFGILYDGSFSEWGQGACPVDQG